MSDPAAIRVESVRCLGFRGVSDLHLELHPKLTVLVGRNNAGKSRVLRAIALALGAVPADKDDLTASGDQQAHVDIVIAPGDGADAFDARVGPFLGGPVRQTISQSPLRERVSWRTTISRSAEGFSARADRFVKQWDAGAGAWTPGKGELSPQVLRLCRGHLIETGRDLAIELRQRGTAAHRLVDDLELDDNEPPRVA